MALAALVLFAVMMQLTGGVRTLIQRQRTGNRRTLLAPDSLAWWALAVADVGYLVTGVTAPLAELANLAPLAVADHPAIRGLGRSRDSW